MKKNSDSLTIFDSKKNQSKKVNTKRILSASFSFNRQYSLMKQNLLCLVLLLCMSWQISVAQRSSPTHNTPPNSPNIRTMAEWEEIEALVVTWTGNLNTGFPNVLSQIIQHAKEECKVIVVCNDANHVINYLNAYGVDTVNVEFVQDLYNTVWVRDYGATTVYSNDVDSLYLVDWIYNRPRPFDDRIPQVISTHIDAPLYKTTAQPYDLVHTGGNFMTDGQGTAFASRLILEENDSNGHYNNTVRTENSIDSILNEFMGIDRFIKTDMRIYDTTRHIDMYMKLLNEETLLVGEYPSGVADGPIIEDNVQYIKNNFNSVFGTPYEIIRIPMPPDSCGNYPDYYGPSCQNQGLNYDGHYRTFTNLVFVNKTVLVPVYSWQYDTTAFRILKKHLPGYKLVGIDCDATVPYSGALHCITHSIGTRDPLLIVHQPIRSTSVGIEGLPVVAKIQHKSLIRSAHLYYRINPNQAFSKVIMNNIGGYYWKGILPQQSLGSTVEYFIKAVSYSGKEQVRPITAPDGFWSFKVNGLTNTIETIPTGVTFDNIYPNPTGDKVLIPIELAESTDLQISIFNLKGQLIRNIHNGKLPTGSSLLETSVQDLMNGTYLIVVQSEGERLTRTLIVSD